jgi:hypothetical protein
MSLNGAETAKRIGVLLVEGEHGVLSDMVRDVLEHAPGIDVVAEVTEISDVLDAVEDTGCNAVVWIVPEHAATVAPPRLLELHPALRIVVVEARGHQGWLWRMRPRREPLDYVSPESIVEELLRQP